MALQSTDNSAAIDSNSKHMMVGYKTSVAVYILVLLPGLWLLDHSISMVRMTFTWPYRYNGPGVTYDGPPPDDFFTGARIITVCMLLIALAYLGAIVSIYFWDRRRAKRTISHQLNVPIVLFLLTCGLFVFFCAAWAWLINTYMD